MPEYEIEWRRPTDSGDQIIRTRWRGSTPELAVENALKIPGGVEPYEVEGWDAPLVREVDEDGNILDPE